MARKTVERNISYDDIRHLYYVSMDLGRDENGKRIKQYRTFPTLAAARNGLKEFLATREQPQFVPAQEMTLSQWLEYWMDSIVRPNRAETTVYAYQKIIDNHIAPALGDTPLTKLSAKQVQEYYTTTQREANLSSNTMRRLNGRTYRTYLTLPANENTARVLSSLLRQLESNDFVVSVPTETHL